MNDSSSKKDSTNQVKWLIQSLKRNDMTVARTILLKLLDMRYSGNHSQELESYKTQLIRMLLEFFKKEAYYLTDALAWQLSELGVTWHELEIIRNGVSSAKK